MAATTAKPVKSAGKIPGSTLKIIAMVCMLIDHTAAVLFDRILISRGLLDAVNASDGGASFLSTGNTAVIYYADMIMRAIGRISFPIFCFLLIEGFLHTHDVKKYALNLGIFALVSEVPFDLAFAGKPFYLNYQNVFFTLFIGLVMMIFLQKIDEKTRFLNNRNPRHPQYRRNRKQHQQMHRIKRIKRILQIQSSFSVIKMHRDHRQKTGDFIQAQQRKYGAANSNTIHLIVTQVIHQNNRQNSHRTVIGFQQCS